MKGVDMKVVRMVEMDPINLFRTFLATNPLKRNCLLGMDVGEKHVGLAVSHINYQTASPLTVLEREMILEHREPNQPKKWVMKPPNMIATELQKLIRDNFVTGIVVGYPFNRQQKRYKEAEYIRRFINDLSDTEILGKIPYTYWNDAFTSQVVSCLLKPLHYSDYMLKEYSAAKIIQYYLDPVNKYINMEKLGYMESAKQFKKGLKKLEHMESANEFTKGLCSEFYQMCADFRF